MTTAYPAALDNFPNPTGSTSQASSPTHSERITNLNDAVEAIEKLLGTNADLSSPSVHQKLSYMTTRLYNVVGYGATGGGVVDDTANITAAIAACAAAGGGVVYFPAGIYKVSSTITISAPGVFLVGAGMWTTVITRSGDYGDTFLFTGTAGVLLTDCGFMKMTVKSTGLTTSGAHLNLIGVTRFVATEFYFLQGFIGLKAAASTALYFSKSYMVFTNIFGGVATNRRFAKFIADNSYAHPSCGDVTCTDFNWRGNSAGIVTEVGIEVNCSDGIWFTTGHLGQATTACILLQANDAANAIGLLFFTGVMTDETNGTGVTFSGSSSIGKNITFTGCNIKGNGAGTVGVVANAACTFNNVQFANCTITEFNSHGVSILGDVKNWDFTGCQVRGNSYTVNNIADGYNIADGDNIRINGGCSGGGNINPASTTQRNGIAVAAGPTAIMVSDCDLTNNQTGSASINAAVATQVRIANCRVQESMTVASAGALTLPAGWDVVHISGTTNITSIAASYAGRRVTLIFDGILTFTKGGNLKINSNFVTTADDTISLVCDGTNWYEGGARSVN